MTELLFAFMLIASRLSGLPMVEELPTVAFLPYEQLCATVEMCNDDVVVGATYDTKGHLLMLPEDWSPRNPQHVSSVVHEMVHHLQSFFWGGFMTIGMPCEGKLELQAYQAEEKFLNLIGESLGISEFALNVMTACDD